MSLSDWCGRFSRPRGLHTEAGSNGINARRDSRLVRNQLISIRFHMAEIEKWVALREAFGQEMPGRKSHGKCEVAPWFGRAEAVFAFELAICHLLIVLKADAKWRNRLAGRCRSRTEATNQAKLRRFQLRGLAVQAAVRYRWAELVEQMGIRSHRTVTWCLGCFCRCLSRDLPYVL